MSTTVTYKGNTIATVNNNTKTLTTQGKYLEDDIVLTDVSGGFGAVYQDENGYVVLDNGSPNTEVLNINQNGIYNVAGYGQANVNVTGGGAAFSIVDTVDEAGGTIRSITTVGAREDLTIPKDVDFIDYDGRLLYSYTATEFLALTALPENPVNPGLVAQGWNWTLADAKEYVGQWGALVIGQSYTTHDGKTRFYIKVEQFQVDYSVRFYFKYYIITACTGKITWGDGSTTNLATGTGQKSTEHIYIAPGNYVIELEVTSGTISLGHHGSNASIFGNLSNNNYENRALGSIIKVEIGSGINGFERQPFRGCCNLESVTIPTNVVGFNDTATSDGGVFESFRLKGIVFPSGFQGKTSTMFTNLNSVKYISLPKSTTIFGINSSSANVLRKLTIYSLTSVTTSSIKLNYSRWSLTHLIMPGTYTTLAQNTVNGSLIKKFTIPATVTTVQTEALMYSYYLEELHVLPTSVPTMNNVRAINGIQSSCKIYVPYSDDHSILDAYKAATNWSTFASQIFEEPQS